MTQFVSVLTIAALSLPVTQQPDEVARDARCGGGIVILSMTPVEAQHLEQTDQRQDDRDARSSGLAASFAHAAVMAGRPIVFSDSSRSVCHSRAVIAPNSASSTIRLSRSRGQSRLDDVDEPSRARRHDADAVGEHRRLVERVGDEEDRGPGLAPQRSSSSPISRRVCWSSAPNGSSSRISRGCMTSVRAMQTRWRMPPESCAG